VKKQVISNNFIIGRKTI